MMGLMEKLDDVKNAIVTKAEEATGEGGVLDSAMDLINSAENGLNGLVQQFKEKGFSETVSSWIGTGENLPISGAQIKEVFSSEKLQEIAGKLGTTVDEASNKLATYLPQVVDKLTPDGLIPEGGMIDKGIDFIKGKLFGSGDQQS
jgi:uncharacterized protein YidB (DUF937 family)